MKPRIYLTALAIMSATATSAFAQGRPSYGRNHRPQAPTISSYSPAFGPAGTTVTIYGDNFARGTKVVYGGITLTPTYLTDSRITFDVPARATDASITLDLPGARRDLLVGNFDVRVPPRAPVWHRPVREARPIPAAQPPWRSAFLASPAVRQEQAEHTQRIARLERVIRLLEQEPNLYSGLIRRVNAAIERENQRHEREMSRLEATYRYRRG